MALKNYYDILGVAPTASQEEIKKAYRKLSLKFHPDKNDGDEFLMDMFKSINEANEILSNSEKKRAYDNKLKDAEDVRNRNDYAQGQQSDVDSDFQPGTTPVDFQMIHALWNQYLKKKEIADKAYRNMVAVRSYDDPKYVTTKRVLSSLLALLLVWLFLKPSATSVEASSINTAYEWVANDAVKIYKKPNVKSKVIGELSTGTQIHALDETNYFIKVNFTNSSGTSSSGYIMKSSLTKNQ